MPNCIHVQLLCSTSPGVLEPPWEEEMGEETRGCSSIPQLLLFILCESKNFPFLFSFLHACIYELKKKKPFFLLVLRPISLGISKQGSFAIAIHMAPVDALRCGPCSC